LLILIVGLRYQRLLLQEIRQQRGFFADTDSSARGAFHAPSPERRFVYRGMPGSPSACGISD
jgi:hypothetical protein